MDMRKTEGVPRRKALKGMGALGAVSLLDARRVSAKESGAGIAGSMQPESDLRKEIFEKVFETPFIDTHEHIYEEKTRMPDVPREERRGVDWTYIFTGYLASDMISAGMPAEDNKKFFSKDIDPMDKWQYLEPYWPAIKNTGYGQAVAIAIREIYGVDDVSRSTIQAIQDGFERTVKPGFYLKILKEMGNIESCQVNSLEGRPCRPF